MDGNTASMTARAPGGAIGAAGLKRVLGLQGVEIDLAAVEHALGEAGKPRFASGRDGLRGLEAAIRILGVRGCQLAATTVGVLEVRHLPVLVEHDGRTFALVELRDTRVVLDGGDGTLQEVALAAVANSPAVWIRPPRPAEGGDDGRPAWALLSRSLLSHRRVMVEVALATFLTSALAVATGMFAQQVYDRVVPSFSYATLWALAGVVGMIIVFDFLLRVVRARLIDRVSRDIDEDVSSEVFRVLGNVRLDAQPRAVGTLAAQVAGLDAARSFFTSGVLFTLAEVPFALLFIAIISVIAGPLAWIYAAVALIAIVVGVSAQFNVRRLSRRQMDSGHRRNGLLVESISGSETIKALGASWRFAERWRAATQDISELALQSRTTIAMASSLAFNLANGAYVAVIVFGVYLIESGSLTVGGLTATTILGGRVIGPIANGLNLLTQMHVASQSLKALDNVLSLPGEREPGAQLLSPAGLGNDIKLEGVRFFYDDVPVPQLDIAGLAIGEGERVVLLGPPGSGKSTLLRLIAGLYRPSSGRVMLGGVDIALLQPERVREMVGLLPQDVQLFRGTLRENLTLGMVADDTRLIEVVRSLGLDALLSDHPRGMDRPIAEGGSGLSVGQRQLCGVARAMIRRPRLWLMDEPTSALDPVTERRMFAALEAMLGERDILIVATHRVASAPFCRRAVVMQRGRVVSDGDRATLQERLREAGQKVERLRSANPEIRAS